MKVAMKVKDGKSWRFLKCCECGQKRIFPSFTAVDREAKLNNWKSYKAIRID